jgi:glucose-6-phosphate dehydrogenase assembly protein OpcA
MNATLGNLLWLAIAAQSTATASPQPAPDLEVIGRLRNVAYESINDPDDILGHGWITARLRISRVLRGRPSARQITIRYLAHSYRSESSPVRLRLRAGTDGTYTVCAEPGGIGLVCG